MKCYGTLGALLLAISSSCGGGESPIQEVTSDVEQCRLNLQAVYEGLSTLHPGGQAPTEGGVKLFAALIASGTWENTAENARKLTCPGTERTPSGREAGEPTSWFTGEVDGSCSGYAGRDLGAHPLPRFPTSGTEILMACDNAGGSNHAGLTNALFADGSVKTYNLEKLIENGLVGEDATYLVVGADSPVDALRLIAAD